MAKQKIKNFKLEQNELKPITIGIFESRRKSSIGIFLILTIFILAVFFLPDISKYINEYLNPPVSTIEPTPDKNKPVVPDDPEEGDKEKSYAYNDNLKIENDEVVVSEFKLDKTNNILGYTVTNNMNMIKNIDELSYYIEIYNKDNTLLERVKLVDSNATLASGSFLKFERVILNSTATNIANVVLTVKKAEDYPIVDLTDGSMICTNTHEEVTYKFRENGLKEMTSLITYKKTDPNYPDIYKNYKIDSSNYNGKTGVSSTWIDFEGGFSVTTNVDVGTSERDKIFEADTFKVDTEAKIVKFEMEAQGFKCKTS